MIRHSFKTGLSGHVQQDGMRRSGSKARRRTGRGAVSAQEGYCMDENGTRVPDAGENILLPGGTASDRCPAGEKPSVDRWLREVRAVPGAERIGMYLIHNGVVRATARSRVRNGDTQAKPVTGMLFSYDGEKVARAVHAAEQMEGVCAVRVWLNSGALRVGDDIMTVLIGADIRPHAVRALESLVGAIKNECVTERELYEACEQL